MNISITCSESNKEHWVDISKIMAFEPNFVDQDNQGSWTIKCPECGSAHSRIAGAEASYVAFNYMFQYGKSTEDMHPHLEEEEVRRFKEFLDNEDDIMLVLNAGI